MNIKKIAAIVLSICLLAMSAIFVNAESTLAIKLDDITAKSGEEFEVNILLENNPGIAGLQLNIGFDKSVMTPVLFQNNTDLTATVNINADGIDLSSLSNVKIVYDSMTDTTATGSIGTIKFKAASDVNVSSSSIYWITDNDSIVVTDANGNDVAYSLTDGSVTFPDNSSTEPTALMGDVNADGKVTSYDATQVLLCASNLKELTEKQIAVADINGDNKITSYDATRILLMASGLV